MNYKTTLTLVLASTVATPLWAAHANPWMTEEDEVLMIYHEENLEQSVDTPLEDAMLGVMNRDALGKLVLDAGSDDGEGRALGGLGNETQNGTRSMD